MLIGDYELSDLRDTNGITVLFIIFTGIGVIILLNVLIAVVSDSYERATLNSTKLFGRARALFVAQNEALEHFLNPINNQTRLNQGGKGPLFSRTLYSVCRWIILLIIIGTACDTTVFLTWLSIESMFHKDKNKYINTFPSILSKSQAVNTKRRLS